MTELARTRPVRPRTRRRALQRWGVRHAQPIEELHESLAAMTASAQALSATAGEKGAVRAGIDAHAFVAAVERAQALPPAPDAAAQASLARALKLWHAAGVLQCASIHPFRSEDSARAAEQLAEGTDEFLRFAQAFTRTAVA